MDDVIQFAVDEFTIKIIARCVCMIARKYNLTWKLKKCRWFPDKVEFVGVDIAKNGNTPAESKKARLSAWALPKTPRDIWLSSVMPLFIGDGYHTLNAKYIH